MKYGIPIAATSLSAWIITQSNKFIMNSISGFSKAALVGVGYGLTLPILMTLFAMITVAAVPRIINLYEGKVDVRPVISRFLGYYILVALPVITVMSLYCVDYTHIFVSNEKMYEAYKLVPYFSFGVFFLSMTDYTTLQYHLANKTHIEFTIKVISGIIGVLLNFVLIPKMGLIGVGIATFVANFLYWLLSVIIVLPDLNLSFPKNTVLKMLITSIPIGCILFLFKKFEVVPAAYQMIVLLLTFYLTYYAVGKKVIKNSD
jgi:O-antigen/teichoic acid export membrane protein